MFRSRNGKFRYRLQSQRHGGKSVKEYKSKSLKIATGCGNIIIIFQEEEGKIKRIQAEFGKSGNCYNTRFGDYTHLINLLLKHNCPIEKIKEAFDGRTCSNRTISNGIEIKSCGDGIAKAIDLYLKEKK
jgi:hypothetical protein